VLEDSFAACRAAETGKLQTIPPEKSDADSGLAP